jgi:hypothetical protein
MVEGEGEGETEGMKLAIHSLCVADGRVGPPPAIREREFFKFHIILAMAMLYMAMLLTDWGAGSSGSAVAMWVKIVTSWVTILLYGWSLVAPLVFPERFQAGEPFKPPCAPCATAVSDDQP